MNLTECKDKISSICFHHTHIIIFHKFYFVVFPPPNIFSQIKCFYATAPHSHCTYVHYIPTNIHMLELRMPLFHPQYLNSSAAWPLCCLL